MPSTFTETCRTATGAVAGHWSLTRGGTGSSPSMGLQVATAWGWLESGYGIAHPTVMGANHGTMCRLGSMEVSGVKSNQLIF